MPLHGPYLRRQRRTHLLFQTLATVACVVLAFFVLRRLAPVLTPIVAALGVAYLLAPLAGRLERRGVPRPVAAAVILGGAAVLVAVALAVLLPLMARDIQRFLPRIPELVANFVVWAEETVGVDVPDTWPDAVAEATATLQRLSAEARIPIFRTVVLALGGVFTFVLQLLETLLVPVFAFYFLVDWPRLVAGARELVPPRLRATVDDVLDELDGVLSAWVRGQLAVLAIEAFLFATALRLLGVPLAIPIGLLAGVLSFIPYVGMIVGMGLALLMVTLDWTGPLRLVGVAGVFVGVQILEGFVLVPRFVGKKVGLGETAALFAVLAGAELLGFVGMMLAIPLAAALAVVLRRLVRYYRGTSFYLAAAPAGDGEPPAGGGLADVPPGAPPPEPASPPGRPPDPPPDQGDP